MFITITQNSWQVATNSDAEFTFPIDGRGMKEFFMAHFVEEVVCSSSIDFPSDGGSKLTAFEAEAILNNALAWRLEVVGLGEAIPHRANPGEVGLDELDALLALSLREFPKMSLGLAHLQLLPQPSVRLIPGHPRLFALFGPPEHVEVPVSLDAGLPGCFVSWNPNRTTIGQRPEGAPAAWERGAAVEGASVLALTADQGLAAVAALQVVDCGRERRDEVREADIFADPVTDQVTVRRNQIRDDPRRRAALGPG